MGALVGYIVAESRGELSAVIGEELRVMCFDIVSSQSQSKHEEQRPRMNVSDVAELLKPAGSMRDGSNRG